MEGTRVERLAPGWYRISVGQAHFDLTAWDMRVVGRWYSQHEVDVAKEIEEIKDELTKTGQAGEEE